MRGPTALGALTLAVLATAPGCGARRADIARGEALYVRACAACHDAGGGIGSRLTPEALRSYTTAQGLYDYNRRFMPYGAERTLPDEEMWEITAYMLVRHGFAERGDALALANAAGIRLRTATTPR